MPAEQRRLITSTLDSVQEQLLQLRGVQSGPTADVARRLLRGLGHSAGLIENAWKRTALAAVNGGVPLEEVAQWVNMSAAVLRDMRPVRLLWRHPRGQVRSWVPQLFARRADGTALLADCPSHPDAGGERARKGAEAVAQACADIGWTYRRLPPLEPVLAANLKWLAGYRHPRNAGRPGLAAAVVGAFARPRPLTEGAEAAGDPIEVLPCVFHALWHGQLTADLTTPLHERVLASPRGSGSPGETGGAR
ncbi:MULTISPECIES: TnsA-like heteromeric transposase endonuclease subunit [unclassified Streptomyces]|uniref:TnsA-like heteromeric transposase endonuclease subunit n=1 Tax=unclassified Streptomyces TaxID=2593676 RepID=UPI001EE90574|nr:MULTISPECIES: TnsA-like heteromeric transposase endonuclease subunit [unclassified Streptomyces]